MPGPFILELPVRFGNIDYARVMYFPDVLDMVHIAMEEFFEQALDRNYAAMLKDERLGFPTVHLDCSFRKPFRLGDVIEFTIGVTELGNRKVVFRYELRRRGELAATITQTTVAVDPETFTSIDLPALYREGLTRHMVSADDA